MKKSQIIITVLLFLLGSLCFIFFEVWPISIIKDDLANAYLCGFISRVSISFLFVWLMYIFGAKKYFVFDKRFLTTVVWSLPCFMVAFVNFPYSAIATGKVTITRSDILGLYILYVFGIALLEELIFRGILLYLAEDLLKDKKHKPLLIVVVCSLIFSLFHLTNLSFGADVGATLLQCIYTFLIGAMLTVTMLKIGNVWLCVLIHGVFNFGGMLTISPLKNRLLSIASGNPWDTLFWILTIVSGVLAAGHVIYSLIKLEKAYVSE